MHVEIQVHKYVCTWQYRYMYVCAFRGTCTFMLVTYGGQKSMLDAFPSPLYF